MTVRFDSATATNNQGHINMETAKKTFQVNAGTRVYYGDINTDKKGGQYVTITEIPTEASPSKKPRQRIFIHANNWDEFKLMIESINDVLTNVKAPF